MTALVLTVAGGVGYTAVMQEPEIRESLLAMRRKLVKEREAITKQIQACDTLLGGLSAGPVDSVAANGGDQPAKMEPGDGGSAVAGTSPVAPSPVTPPAKPPFLTEEARMKLLIRAGSYGRGFIAAQIELIVAELGDTFSLQDVWRLYAKKHGNRPRPRMMESVGSSLWKLARTRGWRVVRVGSGQLPTIYAK